MSERRESGFSVLVRGVREYFEDQDISASVAVGVQAWFRQDNQGPGGANRVVFVRGDYNGEREYRPRPYGKLGDKLGHAQTNPREVAHWPRPVTMMIWAPPPMGSRDDELAQNEMTENLLEAVVAATRTTLAADFVWGDLFVVAPPVERGFGEALLAKGVQKGPLYYPTLEVAFPTAAILRGAVG